MTDRDVMSEAMYKNQVDYTERLRKVAKGFGISIEDANHICYFRSRARWTQPKEDYLLKLARAGKKLPHMMEDFEIPEDVYVIAENEVESFRIRHICKSEKKARELFEALRLELLKNAGVGYDDYIKVLENTTFDNQLRGVFDHPVAIKYVVE